MQMGIWMIWRHQHLAAAAAFINGRNARTPWRREQQNILTSGCDQHNKKEDNNYDERARSTHIYRTDGCSISRTAGKKSSETQNVLSFLILNYAGAKQQKTLSVLFEMSLEK